MKVTVPIPKISGAPNQLARLSVVGISMTNGPCPLYAQAVMHSISAWL